MRAVEIVLMGLAIAWFLTPYVVGASLLAALAGWSYQRAVLRRRSLRIAMWAFVYFVAFVVVTVIEGWSASA